MRLLADECLARDLVDRLRRDGHDVVWAAEDAAGDVDPDVLARAVAGGRILVTRDKDFGDLVFNRRLAAVGIVLVSIEATTPTVEIADRVAGCVTRFRDVGLRGRFTVIETDRTRQRDLPAAADLG